MILLGKWDFEPVPGWPSMATDQQKMLVSGFRRD
jgi:hypothetical protein